MCRVSALVFPCIFEAVLFVTSAGGGVDVASQEASAPPKRSWAILTSTSLAFRREWEHKLTELGKAYSQTLNDLHADDADARRPLMRKASQAHVFTSSMHRDSPNLHRDSALLSDFQVLGSPGICPSCEVMGNHFYRSTDDDENEDGKKLTQVRMLPSLRARFPTQGIYAIDEYHLGGDLKPFRWAYPSHPMFLKSRPASQRRNFWNHRAISLWSKLIHPGSNAIDIGAGIGDTAIQMAAHTSGGRVVAFESNPATALTAQAQSLLNYQFNIDVHPMAVGSKDGHVEVKVDCDHCGVPSNESAVIKVPQVDFPAFLQEHYGDEFLRNVTFVKVDTEGHDKILAKVLQPLLQIVRPKIWVRWFRPLGSMDLRPSVKNSRDLFETVEQIGYIPVNPETGSPVNNHNYMPDILLLPKRIEHGA